jgi:signal peptidase II
VPAAPSPDADAAIESETPRGSRLFWLTAIIAIVVVAADQLTKWWAEANLSDGQIIPVIPGFLRFELVYNPGAAFGLGEGFTWVLAILAVVVAVGVAWYAWRVRSGWWAVVLGLVLGGAITHAGDRMFRSPGFLQGHVVDFIGYGDLFIGNVADIAIVGGAILGAVLAIFGVRMRRDLSKRELEQERAAAAAAAADDAAASTPAKD